MTRPIAAIPDAISVLTMAFLGKDNPETLDSVLFGIFARTLLRNRDDIRLLFLDLDCVMIQGRRIGDERLERRKRLPGQIPEGFSEAAWDFKKGMEYIDLTAVANLRLILSVNNVAIIISSARRNGVSVVELRKYAHASFASYILDKTPDKDDPQFKSEQQSLNGYYGKAAEIQYWFKDHKDVQKKNFTILDDYPEDLERAFRNQYIEVGRKSHKMDDVLSQREAEKAIRILEKV